MERKLFLLLCFIMLAVNCASAVADPDCWYEYQYGTHDYEQVDARKPTCTEDGYYLLECRQCGKNVRKITGNATGHSWKEVKSESYSPTCTENGVTTYACANCAKTRTESVKALGHDMRDEAVVRSPTCEIEGLMSIRCARCGLSDLRDMKRADHQYGEWRVITQATDHSHPHGLFLAVLYYLGLRRGEALGLQWSDIDFRENQVHVQRDIDYRPA